MASSDTKLIDGKYTLGQKSAVGDPRRKWEDRTFDGLVARGDDVPLIVGIVADGVGSADNGARGAELAIQTVVSRLGESRGDDIPRIIKEAVETANTKLFRENEEHGNDGLTTLVVGVVYKDRFYVGNVGDSRAYWIQSSGKILQLTRDHTFYNIYGGDKNNEEAGVVVNAVGKKATVQVDLGFYLKQGEDLDQKEAYRLGLAGLPLHKGDLFLLCSDGLIKDDPKRPGEQYVNDKEIVESLYSEYRPDMAAIKLVSRAEGQRPDDNVSAVTIQYLSPEIIAKMEATSQRSKNKRLLQTGVIVVGIATLVVLVVILSTRLGKTISENSTLANQTPVFYITTTPLPSPTNTMPIEVGKARVDQVNGGGASVVVGESLDSGKHVDSGNSGIQILIGGQSNSRSVLYLFPNTGAEIDFGDQLKPVLDSGSLYIEPAAGTGEVHFAAWNDLVASVSGSRMIVEIKGKDVWIYCFEGTCRLDLGNTPEFVTQPGYKQVFHTDSDASGTQVKMDDAELVDWNTRCNSCIHVTYIPTPTPPVVTIDIDYDATATAWCGNFKSKMVRGTPCPSK